MNEYYQMTRLKVQEAVNGYEGAITPEDVKKHQQKYGPNVLDEGKKKSIFEIFIEQFQDFLVIILIISAIVSGILGDWESTIVILVVITMNALLGTIPKQFEEAFRSPCQSAS